MLDRIKSCLGLINFIKNILGQHEIVTIRTKFFDNSDTQYKYSFKIRPHDKRGITIHGIVKTFELIRSQSNKIRNEQIERLWMRNFGFCEDSSIYVLFLAPEHEGSREYDDSVINAFQILNFLQDVIGLKQNITFNSNIYASANCDDRFGFDLLDDYYEIFGNADKKITIDDIYDIFVEMKSQMKKHNEAQSDADRRYYHFEGFFIDIDDEEPYPESFPKNSIRYSIEWCAVWGC